MSKRNHSTYEKYILEDFDFAPDEPEKFPDSYSLSAADWGAIKHELSRQRPRIPAVNIPESSYSKMFMSIQSVINTFLHRSIWRERQQDDMEITRKHRLKQIQNLKNQLITDQKTERTSGNAVYLAVNTFGLGALERLLDSLNETEIALETLKPASKQGGNNPHSRALMLHLTEIYQAYIDEKPSYTEHEDTESRFITFARAVLSAIDKKQLLSQKLAHDDRGMRVSLKHLAQHAIGLVRETESVDAERDANNIGSGECVHLSGEPSDSLS